MNDLFQKDTITIYSYYKKDAMHGYKKTIMNNCHYRNRTKYIQTQQGLSSITDVVVSIFLVNDEINLIKEDDSFIKEMYNTSFGVNLTQEDILKMQCVYLPRTAFVAEKDYFTVEPKTSDFSSSIICKFSCGFDFVLAEEKDLIKQLENFKKLYKDKYRNVKEVSEFINGTSDMFHIEVIL